MFTVSRRQFFGATAIGAAFPLAMKTATAHSAATVRSSDDDLLAQFPAHDDATVQSVVGQSHSNIDGVRELVTARPALACAAWDWGFGDWESALGAASHVGRRDIAELLIAHGARPDLFTFAMLGQVDVVRALCIANPGIQKLHGPHGITLMKHAVAGGDEAKDVVAYLEELGDADVATEDLPLNDSDVKAYVGRFACQEPGTFQFVVEQHARRKMLTLKVNDWPIRFLTHRGNHVFSPTGCPAVRIAFQVQDGHAASFTIHDGAIALVVQRLAE